MVIAFLDFPDDGQIVNVDRLRGKGRIVSIESHAFAMQDGIPRPGTGDFHAVNQDMAIEAKMPRRDP